MARTAQRETTRAVSQRPDVQGESQGKAAALPRPAKKAEDTRKGISPDSRQAGVTRTPCGRSRPARPQSQTRPSLPIPGSPSCLFALAIQPKRALAAI